MCNKVIKQLRDFFFAAICSVGIAFSPGVNASDTNWPTRSVKLILPLGVGSGTDTIARVFGERLAARWGHPVVVENRPGGDGMIAINSFLNADDDHTLLLTATSAFTAHPYVHEKLPYDANRLIPVARMTDSLVVLAVPANLAVNSVDDLVKMARTQPGHLNAASITGLLDLVFSGFLKSNTLEVEKVPYRNPVDALNDLVVGRIQMMMTSIAIIRPQAEAGRVKMLALTNGKPASIAPNIPTAAESGFPELTVDGLVGVFSVEKMPVAVREKIAADIFDIGKDPEVIKRMTNAGQVFNPGSPDEFMKSINLQKNQAAELGKMLGIKPAVAVTK